MNITCAELSNVTFTNAPPFDVLGVPECGDAVRPQLVLYLPKDNARCGNADNIQIGDRFREIAPPPPAKVSREAGFTFHAI